ncbi:MAG: leucine-rich repeat protein, partial [Bacteroidales bacterium]|nr:leucine-rich repeat protein [Bacteroidales bacterium]
MKKVRSLLFTLLAAVCVVCVAVAFSACGSKEKSGSYGAGEEGFYYYDGANSERYMLSLQSGEYMISVGESTAYSGNYSYDEENGRITFFGETEFSASMGESALSLTVEGSGYSFKAWVYFVVTYVDGDGNTIATESVLNGQSAVGPDEADIEREGYWFIDWYVDSLNSAVYAFDTSIAGDTVVYGWYIEKIIGATEYVVTLDYGDGVTEVWNTTNGAIYKSLPESYGDESIVGWWVSATNKEGELTCRYSEGDVLTSDTTLFAVYSGLETSATVDGITWNTREAGADVAITVYYENGRRAFADTVSSSSGAYTSTDFTLLSTGTYTIEISSGGITETRTYIVNGLPRVSMSSAEVVEEGSGGVFSFAPVEGAEGYKITISNGKRTFADDLGSDTYFDFSDWEMTEKGLTFVVTAYADGYVESVSENFVFARALEKIKIEISEDTVYWDEIENAMEYAVEITDVDGVVIDSFVTTLTSFSLKYYDAGTYNISVEPRADGYWSEMYVYSGYSKDSLAAPRVTNVTNYSISWSAVEGADSYVVLINGVTYGEELSITGTTMFFSMDNVPESPNRTYEISVKAVKNDGEDSPYSDALVATEKSFSAAITYERNTLYWNYDVAAVKYVISVNGVETEVEEGNSFEIALNKEGENVIKIEAFGGDGESYGTAMTTVFAYAITLDPNGAVFEDSGSESGVIYVAKGDEMHLGEVMKEHATFVGWYTQPDYTEGQSDEYEGRGGEVKDGSTFNGSGSMYLYAYWTYEYTEVALYGDSGLFETVKIKYNSTSFTLPTPTPAREEDDFAGWYLGQNGTGIQMTSGTGEAIGVPFAGYTAMYGFTLETRSYSKTTYEGKTVYAVSATSNMQRVTETTIPDSYTVGGVEYDIVIIDNAFANCVTLKIINIPDTVRYISVVNGGYASGCFAGCSALQEVNIYVTEKAVEPMYFSEDGVLFRKTGYEDDVELYYYPYGKSDKTYVVPSDVYNDFEYENTGISHPVTTLPVRVFQYAKMTEITIASSVEIVSAEAFYNNPYIEKVVFAEGGKNTLNIGNGAFQSCTALENVTLPSRYSDFNQAMFEGCYALLNVDIMSGGTYTSSDGVLLGSDGSTLVYYPIGRAGDVTINNLAGGGITKIEKNAFAANRNITSVVISGSVREICESAFEGCTGITSVTFQGDDNSGDLAIRTRAFYGCTSVTEIRLPSNLTVMEEDAFGGCSSLVSVYFNARVNTSSADLEFAAKSFGESSAVTTLTLGVYVPLMDFADIFGGERLAGVMIETSTLSDGTVLENENYWSDEYGVVYNAEKTTILYYPLGKQGAYELIESVTDIGGGVFTGRANLTSLKIGKNVNTIADGAFDGCISLTEIIVDDENINYGSQSGILYGKSYDTTRNKYVISELLYCPLAVTATEIEVPGTVTKIASYAFYENSKIVRVEFKATGDFELGEYAFYGCTKLKEVVLPDGITKISAYAFRNCSALAEINFPDGITEICERAFYGCTALTGDLNGGSALPKNLEIVGERAFSGCSNFAATIPASVREIGDYGFYTCWNTASAQAYIVIESADNPENDVELTIGRDAFCGTHYATGVTIPAWVSVIGQSAFTNLGDK